MNRMWQPLYTIPRAGLTAPPHTLRGDNVRTPSHTCTREPTSCRAPAALYRRRASHVARPPACGAMEAHKHTRAANLAVSFRSIETTNGVPTDSVEGRSEEEALSLTSTGLALTLTGLEVSLVRPGTAAYVENEADTWHGPSG